MSKISSNPPFAGGPFFPFPFKISQQVEFKIIWLDIHVGRQCLLGDIQRFDQVSCHNHNQLRLILLERTASEQTPENRNISQDGVF